MSENKSEVTPSSFLTKLKKTYSEIHPKYFRTRGLGIGGNVQRSDKFPVAFDWKISYSKGAGKGVKSLSRRKIRGGSGPRIRFRIKF